MTSDRIARTVVVSGHVQGVFFRESARREARRLGVAGWVFNRPDGRVEAHVEGPRDAVEALVRWCHDGPRHATVSRVEATPADLAGYRAFAIR